MYDWAWISNDPMMVYRIGMIQDAVVFCFGMLAVWLILFEIGKRYNRAYWDTWAEKYGFKDFEELRFSFTRIMFGASGTFIGLVCMVYFFTHIIEIQNTYLAGAMLETAKACQDKGQDYGLACINFMPSFGFNTSGDILNISGGSVVHYGINQSSQPNQD